MTKNSNIRILEMSYHFIPRSALQTMYTTFIRTHLDLAGIIYDLSSNASFSDKTESFQQNGAFAIIGAIKWTLKGKLSHELGLQ